MSLRLCLAVLLATAAGQICVADEIDDLFRADSQQATALRVVESVGQIESALAEQGSSEAGRLYSQEPDWRGSRGDGGDNDSADESSDYDDDKSAAPFAVTLVPEPSAIGLAALALTYFLLFGRRRTLS